MSVLSQFIAPPTHPKQLRRCPRNDLHAALKELGAVNITPLSVIHYRNGRDGIGFSYTFNGRYGFIREESDGTMGTYYA